MKKIHLLLVGILLVIAIICSDVLIRHYTSDNALLDTTFASPHTAQYPVVDAKYIPDISAQSAIVVDGDSKVVVYSKNPDIRFSPASTTKIMTALTALDYFKPSDILTVKHAIDTQGSGLALYIGEKMTLESLLYAMFLPSANDAAYAVADNFSAGVDGFIAQMNGKAKKLHLDNTQFGDPDGLFDDQDYTTAHDLAFLGAEFMKNPLLRTIVATKIKTITSLQGDSYDIKNRNVLLGTYGVNGIKTGYTDEAGEVLVTSTTLNGHTFIIVVMKSNDRFGDTQKLLQFVEQVTFVSMHP